MQHNQELRGIPEGLSEVIRDGMKHGLSEEQMVKGMVSLGNFADKVVKPDNPEEALLMAVWDEADDTEKVTLARILLRLGKRQPH